jgi:hypothetical protein
MTDDLENAFKAFSENAFRYGSGPKHWDIVTQDGIVHVSDTPTEPSPLASEQEPPQLP